MNRAAAALPLAALGLLTLAGAVAVLVTGPLGVAPDALLAALFGRRPARRALGPDRLRALSGVETSACPCCGQALS